MIHLGLKWIITSDLGLLYYATDENLAMSFGEVAEYCTPHGRHVKHKIGISLLICLFVFSLALCRDTLGS